MVCLSGHTFHVNSQQKNLKWSNSQKPVLHVDSGATIEFDTIESSNEQLTRDSTVEDLKKADLELLDPIFGPVYVNDAEPGDVLEVTFDDLQIADWGWTAVFPKYGLLTEEFSDWGLTIWDLPKGASKAVFKPGIEVPIKPFLGIVGVAPEEPGEFSTIPPYITGGNIDTRQVTKGSKLYLPVKVAGALFSCGDGHAAQGDGEVGGCALETSIKATITLKVIKKADWLNVPHLYVPPSTTEPEKDRGTYYCLGVHSDLYKASQMALNDLITWIVKRRDITRAEAYTLCSVAADLKIAEIVDDPNYVVTCSIPLNIFTDEE